MLHKISLYSGLNAMMRPMCGILCCCMSKMENDRCLLPVALLTENRDP